MPERRPNEFVVLRTSTPDWHPDQPCPEATAVGTVPNEDESITVWTVQLPTIEALKEFVGRHRRCIVHPNTRDNFWFNGSEFDEWPCIEIYDTYRE